MRCSASSPRSPLSKVQILQRDRRSPAVTGLAARQLTWLVTCTLAGCANTLPSAAPSLVQAPNCHHARSGKLTWQVVRPLAVDRSESQKQAINEALLELVKQLAGIEVRSLTRSADYLSGENFKAEFQTSDYAKARGRIVDYQVIRLEHRTLADMRQIEVEIHGRVCTDNLAKPRLLVAIRDTAGLSAHGLRTLQAALSGSVARDRGLDFAEKGAAETYHDIEIRASMDGPQSQPVDRRRAISAIEANLGHGAAIGIPQHAIRVSLTVVLYATLHENGSGFTEVHTAERELADTERASPAMISEMEREAVELAAKALVQTLSLYQAQRTNL